MSRKTSEIVTDLRAQIETVEKMFGPCALSEVMRESANRLEKTAMTSAFDFSAKHVVNSDLKWKVGFRAGVEALRDAISDGSIDDLVKK